MGDIKARTTHILPSENTYDDHHRGDGNEPGRCQKRSCLVSLSSISGLGHRERTASAKAIESIDTEGKAPESSANLFTTNTS
jgi:hypothetical protein